MTPAFLDTSGLLAYLLLNDPLHGLARRVFAELITSGRPLITTSLVMSEMGDALAAAHLRAYAPAMREHLAQHRAVTIVHIDEVYDRAAWHRYSARTDKDWGLTDCASFVIMETHNAADAFTGDRHFEQAGFRCLLRPRA